jgi:Tfp pilus assembly protein PilX
MTVLRPVRSVLRRLRHDEGGFAVATALLILMIISLLSVAVLQTVNVESHQSGHEVANEASFNLAESVLDAESLQVQEAWPGTSAAAFPATCNQSTSSVSHCPGTNLTSAYGSTYAGVSYGSPTWSVELIDDSGGSSYYSDSLASNPTTYDANADNRLWLRATATVWGQREIVVTQITRQTEALTIPQATVTAGAVETENNGNKVIIEGRDKPANLTGNVNLRCVLDRGDSAPSNNDSCAGWIDSKGQLDGTYQTGYTDPNGGYSTLTAAQLAELKATAQNNGTYYNGVCPTSLNGVVYVDNLGTAKCSYNGGNWNSDSAPGALIFASGQLEFNGNATYTGVIYMANGQGTAPTSGLCTKALQDLVFYVHGGATVNGSIFADKCGLVDAGEAGSDIVYDSNASSGLKAFATPSLAKNTFRIIPHS